MINDDFNRIIDYIDNSPWVDKTNMNTIIEKANLIYEEITKNKTKEKILYRLCGQTGSGKTTQLLPMITTYTQQKKKNPVILGVRTCSKYHPSYSYLLSSLGDENIREATNGFALKCMSYVLKLLIENGYMIILDMTLLDPIYENYFLDLLNKYNYSIDYHIMSVSNKVSISFLKQREKITNRKVSQSSIDYFNYILDKGYEYLVENDSLNKAYIWNAYDLNPQYVGLIKNSKKEFNKNRNIEKKIIYSEDELRLAKIKYLTGCD